MNSRSSARSYTYTAGAWRARGHVYILRARSCKAAAGPHRQGAGNLLCFPMASWYRIDAFSFQHVRWLTPQTSFHLATAMFAADGAVHAPKAASMQEGHPSADAEPGAAPPSDAAGAAADDPLPPAWASRAKRSSPSPEKVTRYTPPDPNPSPSPNHSPSPNPGPNPDAGR